jgi:TetR/AcrR family transcriptional regulator, copper-responsive repressor
MDVFWTEGFAAASLDELSAATGLNRPSLYGAFGDKRALYIQAYARYRERLRGEFAPMFAESAPLAEKLRKILAAAVAVYLTGDDSPRGCFTVLTASSDAVHDPEIREVVGEAIANMDQAFERLYSRTANELPPGADPKRLARMTTAWLHTLSVRARAKRPREELAAIVEDAVRMVCGQALKASVR